MKKYTPVILAGIAFVLLFATRENMTRDPDEKEKGPETPIEEETGYENRKYF